MKPREFSSEGRNDDGSIMFRVRLLALIASALRIQFKIGGLPYGASYARAINHDHHRRLPNDVSGTASNTTGATLGDCGAAG